MCEKTTALNFDWFLNIFGQIFTFSGLAFLHWIHHSFDLHSAVISADLSFFFLLTHLQVCLFLIEGFIVLAKVALQESDIYNKCGLYR